MDGLPLHPAIVHLPLGLAIIMPIVAAVIGIAVVKARVPRTLWLLVIFLQLLTVGSAFVATSTGESDEERVERVVDHDLIHEHEEAAEWFLWSAGITAIAAFGALRQASRGKGVGWAVGITVFLSLWSASIALRTGYLGGRLVYVHGAAAAHISGQ